MREAVHAGLEWVHVRQLKYFGRSSEINAHSFSLMLHPVVTQAEIIMSVSRRAFIKDSALLVAAAGIPAASWAQTVPLLSESAPTALALGYKAQASKVDAKKYPRYAAGQSCFNCALYMGGASVGPCPIFAGFTVEAQGWCSSYIKKP